VTPSSRNGAKPPAITAETNCSAASRWQGVSSGAAKSARARVRAVAIDFDRLKHALVGQPAQHAFGNAGDAGQLADRCLLAFQRLDRRLALRRHAFGHSAGQAVLDHRRRTAQRPAARQHHARDRGERGAIVVGGPFDQPPELGLERRHRQHRQQRAQLGLGDFGRRQPLGFPGDADDLPRAERRNHHGTRLDPHPVRHAIIERAERGVEDDEADAVHGEGSYGGD
jgi:hypothetical protein